MAPLRRSFEVRGCLGRGGFGEVYRARMTGPSGVGTEVALKVLLREAAGDGQAARRMRDEGKLLARLHHPAIVQVLDLVHLEGRLALVTELVDGRDLAACVHGPDPLPVRALLEVVARTAEALDAAWNGEDGPDGQPLRLVHRDVKPSNILVSRHGDVRLLDFGLARTDEVSREAHTRTDLLVGSPAYMAPERFLAAGERSASDVFSLGATLFEGLTHARLLDVPVTVAAAFAIAPERYAAHLHEKLALLDAAPDVTALVRAALAFDPDARPTAAELAERCDDVAATLDGPSLARWCRERAWTTADADTTGSWTGRTIEEDSATVVAPVVRPRGSRRPAVAGVAIVALMLMITACAALAGTSRWWWRPEPDVVAGPMRSVPFAVPVEVRVPAEAPAPAPAPSAPARPRVVVPEPAAVEPPRPAQIVVDAATDVEVEIVGPGGEHIAAPATVQPGRYDVTARLPSGDQHLVLEASPGGRYTVKCAGRMVQCSVE